MKETLLLLLCLILLQSTKGPIDAAETDQTCLKSHQKEEECGPYAHSIIKPMMAYFEQVNQKMDKNEAELESKNKEIRQLEENVLNLQMRIEGKNDKINKLETEIASCKDKVVKLVKLDQTMSEISDTNRKLMPNLETKNKKLFELIRDLERKKKRYCTDIGSSGVHNVTMSSGFTFELLCDSEIAGPGWTVIQQRIRGGVNFHRGWRDYRNGFGDFWDGDFFIGLEKLHRLTNEQPHQLYIHMEYFNGTTMFAKYDEFAISTELDQYRLYRLGEFSGNSRDSLRSHLNMKFTTPDRDNDQKLNGNCAQLHHGGWWYTNCMSCNLNGMFSNQPRSTGQCIFWDNWKPLKLVKMMIRPRAV